MALAIKKTLLHIGPWKRNVYCGVSSGWVWGVHKSLKMRAKRVGKHLRLGRECFCLKHLAASGWGGAPDCPSPISTALLPPASCWWNKIADTHESRKVHFSSRSVEVSVQAGWPPGREYDKEQGSGERVPWGVQAGGLSVQCDQELVCFKKHKSKSWSLGQGALSQRGFRNCLMGLERGVQFIGVQGMSREFGHHRVPPSHL